MADKEATMGKYDEAWKNAWSIENMKAHGADSRNLRYIETKVVNGNTLYLYEDTNGDYWYRSGATERVEEEMRSAEKRRKEERQQIEAENMEKKRLA